MVEIKHFDDSDIVHILINGKLSLIIDETDIADASRHGVDWTRDDCVGQFKEYLDNLPDAVFEVPDGPVVLPADQDTFTTYDHRDNPAGFITRAIAEDMVAAGLKFDPNHISQKLVDEFEGPLVSQFRGLATPEHRHVRTASEAIAMARALLS